MPKTLPKPKSKPEVRKPRTFVPPFHNGDRLVQKTFHALYQQTPDGFKAELIGGIVYTASPVTTFHGLPHGNLCTWLGVYAAETEGTEVFVDTTAVLSEECEPQPDLSLVIDPDADGQTSLDGE